MTPTDSAVHPTPSGGGAGPPTPAADPPARQGSDREPHRTADRSRLARGFTVQMAELVLAMPLSAVSIAITLRYLGVDRYGILTAAVVFAGVFDAFSDIGLATVTIRRATAGKDDLEHLVGLNLSVSLLYAGPLWLLTAVAGLVAYAGRPEYQLGVAIVASSLVLRAVATCFDPIFQVRSRFSVFALYDLLGRIGSLAAMLVVVALDLGLVAFFAVQVVPAVARLGVVFVAARRMGRFRPVWNRRGGIDLVREGLPLAAVSLIAIVYYRADGVVLSLLSSETEVGSYGLAYRLVGQLAVIAVLFNGVAFPTLSASFASGHERFTAFAGRCVEVVLVFAAPVATLGVVFAAELVALFGTDAVVPVAADPVRFLMLATALGFVNSLMGQCLIAAHEQRYLLRVSLASLAFNVAANLAVDARWGARGAAVALLATEVLAIVLSYGRLRHATGFRFPVGHAVKLSAVALATFAVWALTAGAPLSVVVPAVGAVFVAGLVVAGPLRPDEVRAVAAMLRPKRAAAAPAPGGP